MTFWQFLNDNTLTIFAYTFFFGGSLAAWAYKLVHRLLDHREKQAKEKTHQLELQLKIAEQHKSTRTAPAGSLQPKESYAQPDFVYEQGYQIQQGFSGATRDE